MSFGPSGDDTKTVMIGGDVVVAWIDKDTLKGYAEDYYLDDKSQCSGPTGSCPDNRLGESTNSIQLLNAAMVNGYSIVTYQRPLRASDKFDRPIYTNRSQAIIWGIGPLNQRKEVSFHSKYLKDIHLIDFGRPARWNCPMPEVEQPSMTVVPSILTKQLPQDVKPAPAAEEEYYEEPPTTTPKKTNGRRRISQRVTQRPKENVDDSENSASKPREQTQPSRKRQQQKEQSTQATVKNIVPWVIPPIQCNEPEDGVFYVQMGPTGGKRGYPAITGHVGWGISWYINGLLIPVINVVRGKTYTFVVEGGDDPDIPAKYHPFYITDDPIGGYVYKTPEEKKNITIFAGLRKSADGSEEPTGTGRLCNWVTTGDLEADDYPSFGAFQRSLELKCDPGEPGFIEWTPDKDTPDTVYYQCFTHRHLGWKINVLDSCDEEQAASEYQPSIVPAPQHIRDKLDTDVEDSPSLSVDTRVKQINIISKDNEDKDTKSIISEKIISAASLPKSSELNPYPAQQNFHPTHLASRHNFYAHQQQQLPHNLHYFKPSTLLNTGIEKSNLFSVNPITTTSSTTTTTTEKPTPPKMIDNIAVASDNIIVNETYLVPPPPPIRETVIYRRPVNYFKVPIKVLQPKPAGIKYYGIPPIMSHKKVIHRIPSYRFKQPFATPYVVYSNKLQTALVTKPPIENQVKPFTEKTIIDEVKNVEVSPQQASTEREVEIQTAPSTSIADITPFIFPAYNTGFKPGSIKIESGFKPIITKEFQDRIDEEDPIVEYESENGKLEIKNQETEKQVLEPMFIPSPMYSYKPITEKKVKISKRPLTKKKHQITKIVIKRQRSVDDSFDEPIAEANERIESYYLPPTNAQPVDIVREPSNIDIDLPESNPMLGSPPDVVITYDGKKLSGQSLAARLSDQPSIINQRLSKASAYVTGRPQFGKFKGELPPLNFAYINKNAPQLQTSAGVLNRELDTPLLSTNEQKTLSTRLSRVKSYAQ